NTDDQVYVPITTVMARLFPQRTSRGAPNVSTVNVQVASEAVMDDTVLQIGDLLRTRHKVAQDDFTIQSQQDFLNTFNQIAGTFTLLLGAIAGISLVVGGIGIMNIMLVSVTERTREIGIRKAIGARRRDILTQFLTEAIVVSVLGGAIGIALGIAIARVASGIDLNGQKLQTVVGTVEKVASDKLTVKTETGSVDVLLTDQTTFNKETRIALTDIKVGDNVVGRGEQSGDKLVVRTLQIVPAGGPRAAFGGPAGQG